VTNVKITLGSVVSYLVGVSLVLLSTLLTIQSLLGLLPLVAGMIILPPVRRQLDSRMNVTISRGLAAGVGGVGIVMAIVVMVAVAGGGGTGGENIPGSDVEDVSVTAVNPSVSDAPSQLEVEWNSRAQSAVDPDPDDISSYESNDGQKYIVVRMNIQNTGSQSVDLTPQAFILRSDGVEYDYQGMFGSGNSLTDVTLNPDGEYSGWVAFSVPEEMNEAELVSNQEAYFDQTVSTNFNRNSDMEINMED